MVETDVKSIPPTHICMYVLNIIPTKIIHTEKQTTKSTKCDSQLNSSNSYVHWWTTKGYCASGAYFNASNLCLQGNNTIYYWICFINVLI
jgi:hypothetical protein